jgi:hypothetical protein
LGKKNEGKVMTHLNFLDEIAQKDLEKILQKETEYNSSWKKRGGVGAFMMLARKWDRIEVQVEKYRYDIFLTIENDNRQEGVLDDIRDLRRYLMLVESEMELRGLEKELKEK